MERIWKFVMFVFALGIASANAANFTVNMTGFQFSPKDLTVNVGDTVTWVNQDATFHDTTSGVNGVANDIWKSPLLGLGNSFSFTFDVAPGIYPYYCTPHYLRFNMIGSITVLTPNNPPSITITNPPDGAIFTAGTNVLIEANASDDNGVERVEFFANGNLIGSDFSAPYSANLDLTVSGTYSLTARAFDTQGSFATSAAINIFVEPPPDAPTIVTEPQSQIVLPGDDVTFSVEATGTPPLFYQWQFNGTNIFGATTTSFAVNNVGANELGNYSALVSNIAGAVLSATAGLTFNPGTQNPTISITISPANFSRLTNSPVFVSGTAIDDIIVKSVEFQVNGGPFVAASGTTNWIAEIGLVAGTNVINFRSVDFAGNFSTNDTRHFTYVVNSPLSVEVRGLGIVRPNLDGKLLEIGKTYQMVARPGRGQIFGGWNGAAISNKAVLNFAMESNLVLTANFISNWFPNVKGTYTGLIFEMNNVRPESSGFFKLKVTGRGKFSGKLKIQNRSFPLHGALDFLGHAEIPVLRRPINPVLLTLDLSLDGTNGIAGEVTDGEWISQLSGGRIFLLAKQDRTAHVEKLDLMSGDEKIGDAVARTDSTLKISGQFSDGEKFAQTLFPILEKLCPFYFASQDGSVILLGWLNFPTDSGAIFGQHLIRGTTNGIATTIDFCPDRID